MIKNRKRTKYIMNFVGDVNRVLEMNGVKDKNDNLFVFACNHLISLRMYDGFNFFKYKVINGEKILALAGSAEEEKYDCLQLY